MERIREAVKLAKQQREGAVPVARTGAPSPAGVSNLAPMAADVFTTNEAVLNANRIIATRSGNQQVAAFDLLRTKVLQDMDRRKAQVLVITSPSPGCGKTVTAINLSLSMARQAERQVFLIDLDLRKPRVASYLGVEPAHDVKDVLDGRIALEDALFQIDVASSQLAILGNKSAASSTAELIVSRQMHDMMARLRGYNPRPIIIVDMPPILGSDDVLAFMPQADCCIMCVAEGLSTSRDITSSEKLLAPSQMLGCVLTKSTEKMASYY